MPDSTKDDLAGYVGARICHDVINPLGAIGNGLELLMFMIEERTPEFDLLEASVRNALARVKFLRIAFGTAQDPTAVGAAESRSILSGFCEGSRQSVDWAINEDLTRPQVRRAFLMLLCVMSALPTGGAITVDSDGAALILRATGPRIAVDPGVWPALLAGQRPLETSAATVQFALLADEIAAESVRTGRKAEMTTGETALTLVF